MSLNGEHDARAGAKNGVILPSTGVDVGGSVLAVVYRFIHAKRRNMTKEAFSVSETDGCEFIRC
jgi:hypothetical protein